MIRGIKFDSKKEGLRYLELESLLKSGLIKNLRTQIKYDFIFNDIKITSYVADFVYFCVKKDKQVVEDVKGYKTREYLIKKKMMKAFYSVDIYET